MLLGPRFSPGQRGRWNQIISRPSNLLCAGELAQMHRSTQSNKRISREQTCVGTSRHGFASAPFMIECEIAKVSGIHNLWQRDCLNALTINLASYPLSPYPLLCARSAVEMKHIMR